MSTQKEIPNALRLAEELTIVHNGHADEGPSTFSEAAAELRAQHELVQTLTAALKNYVDGCSLSVDAGSVARAALAAAEAHK